MRRGVGILLVAASAAACGRVRPVSKETELPTKSIEQVLAAHTDSLMALPGVVGTAIGLCDGVPCIRVLLADSSAAVRRSIPDSLEGYRVRVDVTGRITPRDS